MPQARIRKKATRNHKRRLQANTKIVMATVPAIAQGMIHQTRQDMTLDKTKEVEQIERIMRWSDKCLDSITLGAKSVEQSCKLIRTVDTEVRKRVPRGAPKTVGHYAIVWLMIGYLADEARRLAPQHDKRLWNFFASTVNTWTGMMLDQAPADGTDYEGQAGELADKAWKILFDKPRESFGRL